MGLPRWLAGKESAYQSRRPRFDPRVGKIPWRRQWQPIPVFSPGKSHGQRGLVGYSSRGCKRVGLHWQLNSDSWWWSSFHCIISHFYIFFEKIFIQVLLIFQLNCLLLLSLYILDTRSLSELCFANSFSRSEAVFLLSWQCPFAAQKFSIYMKSTLSTFSFAAYAFDVISLRSHCQLWGCEDLSLCSLLRILLF